MVPQHEAVTVAKTIAVHGKSGMTELCIPPFAGMTRPRIRRGGTRPACRKRSVFRPNPRSPSSKIKSAQAAGLPRGVVLMDAGYGNDTGRRAEISTLGLRWVAGMGPRTSVWPPGTGPVPPAPAPRQRTTTQAASARRGASTALGKGPRSRASRLKPDTPLRGARAAPTGALRASHSSGCDRRIAIPS
jgi:hypothetical protein